MISREHLETTLKLWHSIVIELDKMKDFLTVEKINDQFYRRLLLRNIFSIIETYIFVTRELVKNRLIIEKDSNKISWLDLAALNEKKVILDAEGNTEVRDDFQKFEPSLRFTLNVFAKVFGSNLPNYGDSNFEKLKRLSKRRNQITHPKSIEQLIISDQEVKDVVSMFVWFTQTHTLLSAKFLEWSTLTYSKPE